MLTSAFRQLIHGARLVQRMGRVALLEVSVGHALIAWDGSRALPRFLIPPISSIAIPLSVSIEGIDYRVTWDFFRRLDMPWELLRL